MEKLKYYLITGVACLLVGIVIGWILTNSLISKTDIKWKFGNSELSINLAQDLIDCPTMLSKMFSEDFSKEGTIGWLKQHQNLYEPTDPDIVSKFGSLEYDHMVSQRLRDLSIKRKGPWAYQLDTIRIGIPAEADQPPIGCANVCETGNYFTRKLRILNLDQTREIEVKATGKYECPANLKYPDIQLNVKDAQELLGTINFSQYELGIVLILSD